jgi:hypothetical protein
MGIPEPLHQTFFGIGHDKISLEEGNLPRNQKFHPLLLWRQFLLFSLKPFFEKVGTLCILFSFRVSPALSLRSEAGVHASGLTSHGASIMVHAEPLVRGPSPAQ